MREARAAYLPDGGTAKGEGGELDGDYDSDYDDDDILDDEELLNAVGLSSSPSAKDGVAEGGGGGWGISAVRYLYDRMTGNRPPLTNSDLEEPLNLMRRNLTAKNVSAEVADEICDSVRESLVGKTLPTLGRVGTAVRHALEHAVERAL